MNIKRISAAFMALAMLGTFAYAETADLNGDGTNETVELIEVPGEYDTVAAVSVDGNIFETNFYAGTAVLYLSDLDSDGATEIIVSGDCMSDDYFTYVLRYADGVFTPIEGPDITRSEENGDTYDTVIYGLASEPQDGKLTLSGSQDMLGTYFMERTLALADGRLEAVDDGRFVVSYWSDEMWEYSGLTLTDSINVTIDGSPAVLVAGEQLRVTATDKKGTVWFKTKDGREGTMTVAPNTDSWGCLIDGRPEEELFEYVPYAD